MNAQNRRKAALVGAWAALTLLVILGGAAVIAQDAARPASIITVCPPPGSGCAYTTIQEAINNAGAGDTIRIAAGTYTENLTIDGKTLTLRGGYTISGTEWLTDTGETVVDGNGAGRTFLIRGNDSVLENLTIIGGDTPDAECWGGGVWVTNGDVTIRSSTITGNWADCSGGGIEVNNDWGPAHLTLEDSVVVGNGSGDRAGGISVWHTGAHLTNTLIISNTASSASALSIEDSDVTIQNSTIADNQGGPAINAYNTDAQADILIMRNNIVWGNTDTDLSCTVQTCTVTYSDIEGGWSGVGNIDANPIFVDAAQGDYHLSAWSPCIDGGTASGAPDHDLDGVTRPQNAGYDMGAYEFSGTPAPQTFSEVASAVGLDVSSGDFGAAWGDLDGDGWLDLIIGDGSLFTSSLGTAFHLAPPGATGLDPTDGVGGVAWGDYDSDGDLDLLFNKRRIYRQNSLPFTKIFDANGDQASFAWVDYDLDGDLDAYADGRLYRNDGGDVFTDVTFAAGLTESVRLASAWADYDDDGDPDLYLTCNGCPNQLYRNNGDGTFSDVTGAAGVGDSGSGHGAAWGDYDNDGDWDLLVANNNNEYNVLYRNNGDGTFADVSAAAGLHDRLGFGTGANWLDFDLDGWLDAFIVNRDDANRLYRNNGDGTFTEVGTRAGVADARDSDGSTVGDYDNDGDPDIYVVSGIWSTGTPNLLFRNGTKPGAGAPHWLKVKLVGARSNRAAIGARVRVYGGGEMQSRLLAGSTGYLSQDALEALFGLGTFSGTVTVEVAWPSGVVDTRQGVAVDQAIIITESLPSLLDVAVVNASPGGEVPWNKAFTVVASLRNLGSQPASGVPVTCQIEYGGATVYDEAQTSGDIPSLAWAQLTFPDYTPTALGAYTLTCRSGLPGDENPANDVYSRTLTAVHHPPDAWTKDNPGDNGDVPSGYNDWFVSPDIWVRHQPDGGLIHQDPIAYQANTVYVRLRNRGEYAVSGSLDVTWIESSLGVRCGDWAPIGTIPFTDLLPGETRIVSTTWTPIRSGHTCLQSVIDSASDPYDRGLECAPQWVPYDNNVSWRNVEILLNNGGALKGALDVKQAEVRLVNIYDRPQDVDVIIERQTFPLTGTITLQLPGDLFDRWLAYGGHWSAGIEVLTGTKELRVTAPVSATVGALPMSAGEGVTLGLRFEGEAGLEFDLAFRERIGGLTVGGVAYHWRIPDETPPTVQDTTPAAGATEVALDAPLVITFDEQVGPLSLDLNLSPDPGGWHYTWNEAETVVTATHALLAGETTYTATVTARDAWGNAMAAPATWSFATEPVRLYLPLVLKRSP